MQGKLSRARVLRGQCPNSGTPDLGLMETEREEETGEGLAAKIIKD